MALYVPAGARTRRLVLVGVAALVVGLVAGLFIGRASAPGLSDEVGEVQDLATDVATSIERLPIEYEQSLAGEGGESVETMTVAIDRAKTDLDDAYAAAIWLSDTASSGTDEAFARLTAIVDEDGSAAEFQGAVDDVIGQIETTFGLVSTTTD
jgi:hypothetical protein